MLTGRLACRGYDWWWHNFTGHHAVTGEARTFFVEYFVINPALSPETPRFGQKPGDGRPSYVMIKAGSWGAGDRKRQIHRFFAVADVTIDPDHLDLRVDDARLSETRIAGSVSQTPDAVAAHPEFMSDAGEMSWDLSVDKQIALNVGYGTSAPLRAIAAFRMFWHAQGIKAQYSGRVVFDGEEYVVTPETSFGYADKNWGTDFTSPWIWLASNDLTSRVSGKRLERSAFDVGGGTPATFGVPLGHQLITALHYEGADYDANFSRFWTRTRTRFHAAETADRIEWSVITRSPGHRVGVTVSCPKDEMLLVNYENPDGRKRHHRLWNGGTGVGRVTLHSIDAGRVSLIDDIDARHVGCEYGLYDS